MHAVNTGFRTNQPSPLAGTQGPGNSGFPADFKPGRVGCGGRHALARGEFRRSDVPARMTQVFEGGNYQEMKAAMLRNRAAAQQSQGPATAA